MKNSITNCVLLVSVSFLCCCPVVYSQQNTALSVSFRAGFYGLPNWADTYDIIYDNGGEIIWGAELAYSFYPRFEAGLAIDMISGEGERVWPGDDGDWFTTGEKITFDIIPITLFSRFYFINESFFSPYIGLGVGFASFRETGEETESGFGLSGIFGIDYKRYDKLKLLLEAEYSTYPDVIGTEDLSGFFNEDDIGGLSVRLVIGYSIL